MKRIFLFLLTNVLVVATISIILNLLGIRGYMTASGINYQSLLVFCLVWGMAGSFISLLLSKFMAKMMMGVKIVEDGTHQDIVIMVHHLASKAGISKMPEVGIYDSPEINAFATGATKNNALVAVSSGLLEQMNRDELEGVLAHEISHIANGDMVTMSLVQGVVNAFVMFFSRVAAFAVSQAMRSSDDDRGPNYFVQHILVFVFDLLFSFLAMPLTMWFSRYREFRADEGGAALAGKAKMIAALEKLKKNFGTQIEESSSEESSGYAAFKISNKSSFLALLSSHPPLEARINALRNS